MAIQADGVIEKLLAPAEAARTLGVSTHTLSWWRRVRKGPRFRRVGRHARYAPSDLRTFIDGGIVETSDSERVRG
jgi:Helix-turn-helix domain